MPVRPDVGEICRELILERSVFAFLTEAGNAVAAGMLADLHPSVVQWMSELSTTGVVHGVGAV